MSELHLLRSVLGDALQQLIANHSMRSLRSLELVRAALKPMMVGELCESLSECAFQLSSLSLSGNLDLKSSHSWNEVMPSIAALVVSLRNSLTRLDISSCGITNLGVFVIALSHSRLRYLNLSSNGLSNETLMALFTSLRFNSVLQELLLPPASSEPVVTHLKSALSDNFTLRTITIVPAIPDVDNILKNNQKLVIAWRQVGPLPLIELCALVVERYLLFYAREDIAELWKCNGHIFDHMRSTMEPNLPMEKERQRWCTLLCNGPATEMAPKLPQAAAFRLHRKYPADPSLVRVVAPPQKQQAASGVKSPQMELDQLLSELERFLVPMPAQPGARRHSGMH